MGINYKHTRLLGAVAAAFAIHFPFPFGAGATTVTWIGGTGSWSTSSDWTPKTIPNSTSLTVAIDGGNTAVNSVVSLASTISIGTLDLDAGDSLLINSGGSLTISTLANSGTISANTGGTLVVGANALTSPSAGFLLANGGSISINGSDALASSQSLILENGGSMSFGTLDTNGQTLSVPAGTALSAGSFTNNSGTVQCAGTISVGSFSGSATNAATITLTGSGAMHLTNALNNTGGIISLSGSSTFYVGGTISGGNLSSSGSSAFSLNAGTLSNVTSSATVNFSGYSNSLSGNINNSGQMNLGGSYLSIPVGTLTLSGSGTFNLQGPLVVSTPYQQEHTIENRSTITGYGSMFWGVGGGIGEVIQNDGLILAASSSALALYADQVINEADGTMSVAAGGYLYTRPTQFLSYGAINVSAGGTLQISGESGDTSTINSITNAGTVSITDNISNISTFSGGTLSVSYFSSVNVGRLSGLNNLSVGYPGSVAVNQQLPSQVNPAAIPSNSTQTLTISTYSAGLDVTNNSLLINYGIGADPKNTIIQYLASGSNGGSWNGLSGIISSTAAAQGINGHYGVGYADGADGIDSSLAAGQLEVAYTLYGDMTLQGVVDITDLNLFAQYYGKVVSGGWAQGDFLGTGTVNATDFGLLAANFGQTTNGTNAQLPASEFEALDAFADENGLDAYLPEPPTFAPCVLLAIFGAARPKRRKVGRDLEVAGS